MGEWVSEQVVRGSKRCVERVGEWVSKRCIERVGEWEWVTGWSSQ